MSDGTFKDMLPTVKPEISFGQIAQILMLLSTVGSLVWYESTSQEAAKKDIASIQRDMGTVQRDFESMNLRVTRMDGTIALGQSTDELQKERMSNLIKAYQDQRELLIRMMSQLNAQGTSIAVITTTLRYLEKDGPITPNVFRPNRVPDVSK